MDAGDAERGDEASRSTVEKRENCNNTSSGSSSATCTWSTFNPRKARQIVCRLLAAPGHTLCRHHLNETLRPSAGGETAATAAAAPGAGNAAQTQVRWAPCRPMKSSSVGSVTSVSDEAEVKRRRAGSSSVEDTGCEHTTATDPANLPSHLPSREEVQAVTMMRAALHASQPALWCGRAPDARHESFADLFAACGSARRKHALQESSIVARLAAAGLLLPDAVYVELGAGSAQLSAHILRALCHAQKLLPPAAPNSSAPQADSGTQQPQPQPLPAVTARFVLVDRMAFRSCNREDGSMRRLAADLALPVSVVRLQKDIALLEPEDIVSPAAATQSDVVFVSKHLCGAATDTALSMVARLQQGGRLHVRGICLATCCHYACDLDTFCGTSPVSSGLLSNSVRSHSALGNVDAALFEVIRQCSQWATLPDDRGGGLLLPQSDTVETATTTTTSDSTSTAEPNPDGHFSSPLTTLTKRDFGRTCKSLIDEARAGRLRVSGWPNAGLWQYTDQTPENVLLMASERQSE
eukprot:m.58642 g.58642  ORF g.58642 m.58642 type:complete len:524 (+) comp13523_c0_seq1:203-1774(+)